MGMPVDFHAQILNRIEESGQTMKGYFMALARKDLKEENSFKTQ